MENKQRNKQKNPGKHHSMTCLRNNQLQKKKKQQKKNHQTGRIFENNMHFIESDNLQYIMPKMLQSLFVHENESRFTPGKKEKCN